MATIQYLLLETLVIILTNHMKIYLKQLLDYLKVLLKINNKKMNPILKLNTIENTNEIVRLLKKSIIELCGPDYGNDSTILNAWIENKTEENLIKWIESKETYSITALVENTIVGFGLSNITGEILLLYILPEYKRKGIGESIYLYIEELLLKNNVTKVIAYSTITAKPFYLKMGFSQFGSPIKVGKFDGEYPLEKSIVI
ncbi:hypothetical protein MNBD_GAMMA01-1742 [hydrothermal vent metagenome]|uniref:N-acetyltransferase domain-containing protein n=1 Tax=hydrothermal vent metagenome TaxID=652676 RepID=A0A3B0WBN7_9ZZZZ